MRMPVVGDVQFELPAMRSLRPLRALKTARTEFEYTARFMGGDISRTSTRTNWENVHFVMGMTIAVAMKVWGNMTDYRFKVRSRTLRREEMHGIHIRRLTMGLSGRWRPNMR